MPSMPYGPAFEPLVDTSRPDGHPAPEALIAPSGSTITVPGRCVLLYTTVALPRIERRRFIHLQQPQRIHRRQPAVRHRCLRQRQQALARERDDRLVGRTQPQGRDAVVVDDAVEGLEAGVDLVVGDEHRTCGDVGDS